MQQLLVCTLHACCALRCEHMLFGHVVKELFVQELEQLEAGAPGGFFSGYTTKAPATAFEMPELVPPHYQKVFLRCLSFAAVCMIGTGPPVAACRDWCCPVFGIYVWQIYDARKKMANMHMNLTGVIAPLIAEDPELKAIVKAMQKDVAAAEKNENQAKLAKNVLQKLSFWQNPGKDKGGFFGDPRAFGGKVCQHMNWICCPEVRCSLIVGFPLDCSIRSPRNISTSP